jgi:hypothetical protein
MSEDDLQLIARIRRAMPRNADVLELCQRLERRVVGSRLIDAARGRDVPKPAAKFDKKSYQREYMKKRRAEKKGAK